jgi:hypothetical protein
MHTNSPSQHHSRALLRFSISAPAGKTWRGLSLQLFALLLLTTPGCSRLVHVVEWPFKEVEQKIEGPTETRALTPVELQTQLMRFADSYHSALLAAVTKLREDGKPPDAVRLLNMKLRYSDDLYAVVTGPNPFANLLDMVVVVTMTRMQLEDYWMPKVFGSSAETLLAIVQQREKSIWALASVVLTPSEQRELRKALQTWHAKNRELKTLDEMRASGFATSIAGYGKSDHSLGGSVFDLLDLDPLSALDPATREIARTRHFAERALFLVQRMPTILRWQSELLATSVARLPEIQTALADTTRLTEATERMSRTAEQLPADLARERQIILDALRLQSGSLSTLAGQVQQTLKAGTEMANSTNATLQTFDHVYAELHGAPKDPKAKPFRIDDYKELATQIAVTATEINDTLKSLEALAGSPSTRAEREYLAGMAADLERRGDRLIERLIRAGQLLIALACSGLLAALLIYRLIAVRWPVRAPSDS